VVSRRDARTSAFSPETCGPKRPRMKILFDQGYVTI
jgi:hypothetical protein